MILSEVCDIDAIKTIGKKKGFNWKLIERKTVWGERNYIYNLVKI
jgi:hypothetical protein